MLNKEELIQKFLNNSCNDEEMRLVMEYIKEEPTLIEEIFSKSEWDAIDISQPMKPTVEKDMKKNISSKIGKPVRRISKSLMVAAAILIGITASLIVLYNSIRNSEREASFSNNRTIQSTTEIIENKTALTREIMLGDKSTVRLFPGSSIEFSRAFTTNRSIQLKGKAIFNVTHNPKSPFVVYSGAIRTTALGTRFLVDNRDPNNRINVKLYQGRVVVQSVESTITMEKTFLDAGEQCFVDVQTMQVQVEPIFTPKNGSQLSQRSSSGKVNRAGNKSPTKADEMLHFTKTRMSDVFEKLQQVFNQTIQFNKEEVGERYFTGSFSVNDSLSVILGMISVTSDLSMSIGDDGVILIKNQFQDQARETTPVDELGLRSKMKLDDLAPAQDLVQVPSEIPALPQIVVINNNEVSYNRIALPDLLKELQKKTKKTIHYDRSEIENINFTGSILFDVNMRNTLSMICSINGLVLQVKQGSYYIKKDQ